jgi:diguanylate cyclase (GGDEF)-like protein
MPRPRTFRALSVAIGLVLVLAMVATAASLWNAREHDLQSGVREARNTAVVLAGQLTRALNAIDIALHELASRIEAENGPDTEGAPRITDPKALREAMLHWRSRLPQAFNIAVADSQGRIVLSTAGWPAPDINVADREHFQDLAANDDGRMSASLPFRNRVDNEPAVAFARRINSNDHRFLGIVFVSLSLRYFEQVYRPIEALAHQTFMLARSDGRVYLRHPDTLDRAGSLVPSGSRWYEVVAKGGGSYRSRGIFDNVARWVAVESLQGHPLVVSIGVPEDVLLAEWRAHALVVGVVTASFLAAVLFFLTQMTRQYRLLSASEISLAEKSEALVREHGEVMAHKAELQLRNRRFDAALNNMSQGLAMYDAQALLVVCNARYGEIYGIPPGVTMPGVPMAEVLTACSNLVIPPLEAEHIVVQRIDAAVREKACSYEYRLRDDRIVAVTNRPMPGGGWLSTHEDVTDRRQAEERIKRLAHSDLLTGVANRSHFLEEIAVARRRLEIERRPFSVLMLDLDHFKHVNDSLGHAAGDALLKEVAARLRGALRAVDVLARLGGDEFAVVQTPPREFVPEEDASDVMAESAIVLAGRIIDLIDQPFDVDGHKVVVGASIGIAMAPKDAVDADELMKKADLALYTIKAGGRNGFAFFNQAMAATADERHRLEVDFREGLARGEFELYYQPLVDAVTQQLRAMEALVRWNHPDKGLIAPDRFIAMAEDTGLVGALGEWILQTACAEAATWPDHIKIAVNISPVQFRKTNLLDVIMCALVDSGLPPERLEIEITERVLLEWQADHLSILHQLKNLGISVALDDFGTGYSSLSYLTTFPFDKLKIDRSFTRDLLARDHCGAIVCAIVNLGRSLDMLTLAEGVESEAQLRMLRAAGVDQVQGYYIGRPAPARDLVFETGRQQQVGARDTDTIRLS